MTNTMRPNLALGETQLTGAWTAVTLILRRSDVMF